MALSHRVPLTLNDEQRVKVEENINLVWGYIWKYRKHMHDDEDYIQGLLEALCCAVIKHDPSRGALATIAYQEFETFNYHVWRHNNTKKRKAVVISYNVELPESEEKHTTFERFLQDKSINEDDQIECLELRIALADISPYGRQLLELQADGITQCELSKAFGVSQPQICRDTKFFRNLVKRKMGGYTDIPPTPKRTTPRIGVSR